MRKIPTETDVKTCGPLVVSFTQNCLKEKQGRKLIDEDSKKCKDYRPAADCLRERCGDVTTFPLLFSSIAALPRLKRGIDRSIKSLLLKSRLTVDEAKLFYSALNGLISVAGDECSPIFSKVIVEALSGFVAKEENLLAAVHFVSENKIDELAKQKNATCSNEPAALLLVWVYHHSTPWKPFEQRAQEALKFFQK